MSPDTRLMVGLSLILVPTIVYGGLTVLGVVTNRLMGHRDPRISQQHRSHFIARATPMLEFLLFLQCSCKSRSIMLRSQVYLYCQSERQQSPHQFSCPADSSPWHTPGRCASCST
jgi:hypothetical protein